MNKMIQLELEAHRDEIIADMRDLFEKYRAIFDWDIPEINQSQADSQILATMHTALDEITAA